MREDVCAEKGPARKLIENRKPKDCGPESQWLILLMTGAMSALSADASFEADDATSLGRQRVRQFPDQDQAAFAVVLHDQSTVAV